MTNRRVGFDVWDAVEPQPTLGHCTTLESRGAAKRKREFNPGFAGANPGPSYEDEPMPRPPRRKKHKEGSRRG